MTSHESDPESDPERGLLSEDHTEIKLVPQGVRDLWQRGSGELGAREREAWRAFLRTADGRAWLRERAEAHRR